MVYKDGTNVAIESYNNDIDVHGSIWTPKGEQYSMIVECVWEHYRPESS